MTDKIRWGVLGAGGIARRRTIPEGILNADNARLVSVFDINPAINADVAACYGARPANSVEDLLADDIQAVYVATPANCHYQQVVAAAKARKHVLCEKPFALTVPQAEKMAAACRTARVKFGAAFMMRFHSRHQAALQLIRDGRIGKPVYARAQLSCWYPPIKNAWRQNPALGGGGSLIDMASHCIDLLEMFFGPVVSVACFTNRLIHKYQSEDSAAAMLQFKNGAIGTVDAFFCIPDNSSKNRLELYGSKGSILAEGTIGQGGAGTMIACLRNEPACYDAKQTRSSEETITIAPPPVNTYRAEIEEFSAAILEKRQPSNSSVLGLRSQKIIAACYQSAKTGKTVDVR
jgi:predicted dehydrogenase